MTNDANISHGVMERREAVDLIFSVDGQQKWGRGRQVNDVYGRPKLSANGGSDVQNKITILLVI